MKRSKRKSIGLEVKADGQVIVRAPLRLPDREIRRFVNDHMSWIEKHQAIVAQRNVIREQVEKLTEEEIHRLKEEAAVYIPQRVAYYASQMGVSYGRITIRQQKTRWGSCSAKGNLNFNCLLMLAPPEVLDSVVVHELCHRKEMNHSPRFYAEIAKVFPEYRKWYGWLKKHGTELLDRL